MLPLIQRSLWEELSHSSGDVDRPVHSALERKRQVPVPQWR